MIFPESGLTTLYVISFLPASTLFHKVAMLCTRYRKMLPNCGLLDQHKSLTVRDLDMAQYCIESFLYASSFADTILLKAGRQDLRHAVPLCKAIIGTPRFKKKQKPLILITFKPVQDQFMTRKTCKKYVRNKIGNLACKVNFDFEYLPRYVRELGPNPTELQRMLREIQIALLDSSDSGSQSSDIELP